MAAATGFAISAALDSLFARCGVDLSAVISFGFNFAVRADYLVGKFFNKLFKSFSAVWASVL